MTTVQPEYPPRATRGRWLLRTRLATLVVVTVVAALAASGIAVDRIFDRLSMASLEAALARELDRTGSVLVSGALGQELLSDPASGLRMQLVSATGRVVLPVPGDVPIPLADTPRVSDVAGARELVAASPWVLPSGTVAGTVRIALDLAGHDRAHATLRATLLAVGGLVAVIAGAMAVALVRRTLRPLTGLATQAAAVDPAAPRLAAYRGPEDEVAEVARALNAALTAIRARQQAERDALAEVAHELAAPLSVVAGQLRQLALERPEDAHVGAARDAADELLHTSQDLLTLARGELEAVPEISLLDAADVARSVADAYPGVTFRVGGGDARVFAHPDRLRQALRNLVRNAVQAAGAEAVRVMVVGGATEVWVTVEDDGPGVPPDVLARVFERHVSGRPGGAGLGLAVARRIVEAFDGRIDVRSVPGDGTAFEVRLPAWTAQIDPAEG